jgi:hypothetical protein
MKIGLKETPTKSYPSDILNKKLIVLLISLNLVKNNPLSY